MPAATTEARTPYHKNLNRGPNLNSSSVTNYSYEGATPSGLSPSQSVPSSRPRPSPGCYNVSTSTYGPGHTSTYVMQQSPSHPSPGGTLSPVCGLSGMALEKQLMQATKEELVQILLELGSCNANASSFIQSKARFFSFRHGDASMLQSEGCDGPDSDLPSSTLKEEEGVSTRRALQLHDCSVLSASGRPTPKRLTADPNSLSTKELPNKTSATPVKQTPSPRKSNAATPSQRPDSKPFSEETHPCLRWYGACRNPTSCVFSSAPQNLCLNWVRGSCAAGMDCSGVHRMPTPCSKELTRLYELSHGQLRRDIAMAVTPSPEEEAAHTPVEHTPRGQVGAFPRSTTHPHSDADDTSYKCMSPERPVEEDAAGPNLSPEYREAMDAVSRCLQNSFNEVADSGPISPTAPVVDTTETIQPPGAEEEVGGSAPQPRSTTRSNSPRSQ
ncbi:hypothetical protein, conserved [Angomonas deanei]|uniref:C3H1-type domain-containing protein n=1 Tax=Angomonas deanei TaxID=59799 RepID=A0A7G2CFS4_9TRYP|nr:hypothetical protein, conserved [Angomonas deanei]